MVFRRRERQGDKLRTYVLLTEAPPLGPARFPAEPFPTFLRLPKKKLSSPRVPSWQLESAQYVTRHFLWSDIFPQSLGVSWGMYLASCWFAPSGNLTIQFSNISHCGHPTIQPNSVWQTMNLTG
jgi:hypothetical protein